MLNTSEHVDIKTRVDIVDEFTKQLLNSGYDWDQVRRIIVSGLTGYENMLSRARRNGSGIHRSAAEGAQARRQKKLLAKSSWFRSPPKTDSCSGPRKGNQEPRKPREEPVSVIFVPQTRFGALAAKLKQDEVALTQITGEKLKVTERSGTTIRQLLISSNPWQAGDCGKESCLVCRHGDGKQVCSKRNCLYETFCIPCKEKVEQAQEDDIVPDMETPRVHINPLRSEVNRDRDGDDDKETPVSGVKDIPKLAAYCGESKMTPRECGDNHQDDYVKNLASSHMFKHFSRRRGQPSRW